MTKILSIGRWLFSLSFLMYVALHFGNARVGASFVPAWIPFPYFWNYFCGVCVLAFVVSALIGTYDKLAAVMMAVYVLLMIFLVHIPRAAADANDALNIFRNLLVIGALLVYAKYVAKDTSVVG